MYTSSFLAALFFFHCYFYFYSRFLPRREQNASVTILFRKRNKQVTVISEPRPSPERKANVAISHSCVFAHAGASTRSLNAAQYKTKTALRRGYNSYFILSLSLVICTCVSPRKYTPPQIMQRKHTFWRATKDEHMHVPTIIKICARCTLGNSDSVTCV